MTITELLAENPGVELTLAYNDSLCAFSVKAKGSMCEFNAIILESIEDLSPGFFVREIKRGMEAVR